MVAAKSLMSAASTGRLVEVSVILPTSASSAAAQVPLLTIWFGIFPIILNWWAALGLSVYYVATTAVRTMKLGPIITLL